MSWFKKKKKDEQESKPAEEVAVCAIDDAPAASKAEEQGSWFSRLKSGLTRSSNKLTGGISDILTKRKLDDEVLEELEDLLITSDLGPVTAARLTQELAKTRFGKDVSEEEVQRFLADGVAEILEPVAKPLVIGQERPYVILVAGVNGAGKTTTIGKLARQLTDAGHKVMMAAGDTFRAAAVEQLKIWGERVNCTVVSKDIGHDAAALVYESVEQARAEGADVLLIDTAGRLQNKSNLMAELEKIVRVLKKQDEAYPHATLLVLDATTGQNAHSQVEIFGQAISVTGLILTKLDGSAKGGVLVSLAEKFKLPVHAIGVGEKVEDLHPFDAKDFGNSLLGLEG